MPSGELATVLVRLTADASDFISTMDQANSELKDLAINAAALTAAGAAIGAALTGATEYASKYETEIFNLSQRTGIATDTISALAVAADAQGKTLSSVEVAFRKLGLEAENAALGQRKALEVFNAIGVSVKDESGRVKELSDLFPEVNEGLSKVGDSTIRVGLANDLYGRSSLTLLPVLGGGIDKLNEFADVATKTGVMVTQSQADQGKAFQLTQLMAEDAFKGLAITIGNMLMPALAELATSIEAELESLSKLAREYPVLTDLAAALAVGLIGSGGLLLAITGVTAALVYMDTVIGTSAGAIGMLTGFVGVLSAVAYTFRNDLAEIITLVGSKLAGVLASIIGPIATLAGEAGLTGMRDRLMNMKFSLEETSKDWADQSEQFSHTVNAATPLNSTLQALMASLKGMGDGHLEAVPKISAFESAVNRLVDSVTEEIKKGPTLVAALERMTNAHESEEQIIDVLGPKIVAYGDALIKQGTELDAVTRYYYDLVKSQQATTIEVNRYEDAWQKAQEAIQNNLTVNTAVVDKMTTLNKNYFDGLKAEISAAEVFTKAAYNDELKDKIALINETIAADMTYASKMRDLAAATASIKKDEEAAYADFVFATEYLITQSENGASEEQLKDLKDNQAEKLSQWTKYHNELLKLTGETTKTADDYWKNFYTSQDMAQQNMELGMARAMGNLTSDIAVELSKDIVTWSGWGESLKKIATDVSEQMLQAFLKGLLNPLTNALQGLGKSISDTLSGAVGGGGGVGGAVSGGLFGSALGGAIPIIGGAIALGGLLGSLFGGGPSDLQKWQDAQTQANQSNSYGYTGITTRVFAEGTSYVANTGPAIVHEGERIVTAADNQQLVPLLKQLIDVVGSGHDIYIDGTKIGTSMYKSTRNMRLQLVGAR